MRGLNLTSFLSLLSAVGPAIAAAPAFKEVYDDLVEGGLEPKDQPTAKKAYELSIANSDEAHEELQALVRERAGGLG